MTIPERQEELLKDLSLFQDWTERYEYVIGLGRKLTEMPPESKTEDKLIEGCQSRVWLAAQLEAGAVRYKADSDSQITKGMIALFILFLDGESPENSLTADFAFMEKTGLKEHLAPTRANALNLMAIQMKQRALDFAGSSG
ncbi:MAG: SufE family protein [Roseibacillus sp.]|nr:SufE family protein [Roseibacillus sp.]